MAAKGWPSLYEVVGFKGLVRIMWSCTPLYARPVGLPLLLLHYQSLFANSYDFEDLSNEYRLWSARSGFFRWARPRYHRVCRTLRDEFGITQ